MGLLDLVYIKISKFYQDLGFLNYLLLVSHSFYLQQKNIVNSLFKRKRAILSKITLIKKKLMKNS